MSEAFLNHPARDTVRAILALEGNPQFSDAVLSADKYRRIRDLSFSATHAIEGLLDRSVPQLVSVSGLNSLNSALQGVLGELNAYVSNGNFGHIANLSGHCDQVLQLVWVFGPQIEQLGKRALSEIFKFQEKSTNAFIEQLQKQRDDLVMQLNEALKRTSDLQSQIDSFKNSLSKTEAEAAAAVAKLDAQFANDERERTNQFQEKIANINRQADELNRSIAAASDEVLKELRRKQGEAAKIVQVVGNIGVTGNYQNIADKEEGTANAWRGITVGFFLIGIGLAVSAFLKFLNEPINEENFFSISVRLLFAIAVAGPAWYTAKESARHRTNSDRARKLELELASFGPFIELLPDEQKHQIREKLTHVYFGGADVEPHTPGQMVDINAFKDAVIEILKTTKK